MTIVFYLIHFPLFTWVALWYFRQEPEHPLRRYYWLTLGVKLAAAILIGILYSGVFNTTGDTYAYMIDGNDMYEIMRTDFSTFSRLYFFSDGIDERWYMTIHDSPRYWFFYRIIYPLNLLCGLQYWIITSWLTFFCFLQLYKLSAVVLKYYRLSKTGVVLALLFMPSVVYWSAGLNKETVALATIAYLVRLFVVYLHEREMPKQAQLLCAVFFVLMLWQVKFYFAAVLLPCLLGWYVWTLKGYLRWWILGGAFILMAAFFTMTNRHLSPKQFSHSLYQNYTDMINGSAKGSYFTLPSLAPDGVSVIKTFPMALWYGSFTPQLWEAHYFLAYLAALQNTVVLILFLVLLWKWDTWTWSKEATIVLIYCVLLAGLLAMASPNWGSLLRYKVSFEPFGLLLILGAHPWLRKLDTVLFS